MSQTRLNPRDAKQCPPTDRRKPTMEHEVWRMEAIAPSCHRRSPSTQCPVKRSRRLSSAGGQRPQEIRSRAIEKLARLEFKIASVLSSPIDSRSPRDASWKSRHCSRGPAQNTHSSSSSSGMYLRDVEPRCNATQRDVDLVADPPPSRILQFLALAIRCFFRSSPMPRCYSRSRQAGRYLIFEELVIQQLQGPTVSPTSF